jgi:hypothetical protein
VTTVQAGTVSAPAITTTGDTNTGIFFPAADQVAVATNGVERVNLGNSATVFNDGGANVDFRVEGDTEANLLFVDASTDAVGIGTSSPVTNLHIGSGSGNNLGVLLSRGATTNFYEANDGTKTFIAGVDNLQDFIKIGSLSSHPVGFATGNNERMRIDSAGNVGIGTSSPTNKLHVAGTVKIEGSTLDLNDAGTFTISQNTTSSALVLRTAASSYMRFDTNGSNERMRIDSSGNLLVNRTTVLLDGQYCADYDGNSRRGIVLNNSSGTNGANLITFASAGSAVASISQTSASVIAYNTSSDYRLKEAIAPMTGALAKVALLKPCTYKWKVDGSDGQGFIAHEVEEIVPGCVTGEKDAVDAEGNPQYQGIDTSFLVATLTAAIQEQQAIINDLKARLDAANL